MSSLEDKSILNSVLLANVFPDKSIDKNNSVLPSSGLFSFSDIQKRLQSSELSPIELCICYSESDQQLLVTRGLFGEIPLFYIYQPNSFFCFSTSLKALSQLEIASPLLIKDEKSIANFLSVRHLSDSYHCETFIKPITKVLPGHTITVSSSEIRSDSYIRFNLEQWSSLKSKEEYSDVFRDLFKKSLKFAVAENVIIGAHLSGGLDSSSISSTTRHLFPDRILHTFYGDTNTSDTDEKHYAIDVVKNINSIHHIVEAPHNEVDKAILHTSIYATPLNLIHSPGRQNAIIQAIKNTGCTVILSGEGGDGVTGYGMEYIVDLINHKQWAEVKKEFKTMASLIQQAIYHPQWPLLPAQKREQLYARETLYKFLVTKFKSLTLHQFGLLALEICREFQISPFFLFGRGFKGIMDKQTKQDPILSEPFLSAISQFDLVKPINLANELYSGISQETQNSYGSIFNLPSIAVREDTYALSSYYGMSTRFPFYNKELLEISMATPAIFKYDNGMRRGHLREAMKGILPESVRLRFGKAAFDQFAMQSAIRLYDQSQDFLTDSATVWQYVSKEKFRKLIQKLKLENETPSTYTYTYIYINRTIFLAIWLDWYKNNIK